MFWRRKPEAPVIEASSHRMMESLGELQLTAKLKLHLVRIGSRVLVLHLSQDAVQTVTEIVDPQEVATLTGGFNEENGNEISFDVESVPSRRRMRPLTNHPQVSDLLRNVELQTGAVT